MNTSLNDMNEVPINGVKGIIISPYVDEGGLGRIFVPLPNPEKNGEICDRLMMSPSDLDATAIGEIKTSEGNHRYMAGTML